MASGAKIIGAVQMIFWRPGHPRLCLGVTAGAIAETFWRVRVLGRCDNVDSLIFSQPVAGGAHVVGAALVIIWKLEHAGDVSCVAAGAGGIHLWPVRIQGRSDDRGCCNRTFARGGVTGLADNAG